MKKLVSLVKEDGSKVLIESLPFKIGSFEDICDFVVDSNDVSPIHCVISEENNELKIKEMNTKIGLIINDKNLTDGESIVLKNNDKIKISDFVITFNEDEILFEEEEIEELNNQFKTLLNTFETSEQYNLAEKIIKDLWDKIKKVNSAVLIENKNIPIEKATTTYLNNIFAEDLTVPEIDKAIDKTTDSNIDENDSKTEVIDTTQVQNNIEENSFKLRHPRRTLDNEEDFLNKPKYENTASFLKNRRVKVDLSKIRKASRSSNNEFSNSVNNVQPSLLILKEVNPPYTVIEVSQTPFNIGRSGNLSDFTFDRKGISRIHATILQDQNKNFLIKDNNATNGTFINNQRLINNEALLNLGDHIKFYDYEFCVSTIQR